MGWLMLGKPYETADMAAAVPTATQRFVLPSSRAESLLGGVVVGLIIYADPVFTSIKAELWSDRNGSPGVKIAESTTVWEKAALHQLASAYMSVGFAFPSPSLRPGAAYHIALRASGYVGDDASHLAWRHSYPDPQYRTGLTLQAIKAAKHPFELSIIAGEL